MRLPLLATLAFTLSQAETAKTTPQALIGSYSLEGIQCGERAFPMNEISSNLMVESDSLVATTQDPRIEKDENGQERFVMCRNVDVTKVVESGNGTLTLQAASSKTICAEQDQSETVTENAVDSDVTTANYAKVDDLLTITFTTNSSLASICNDGEALKLTYRLNPIDQD
jgi:hypothetical protein